MGAHTQSYELETGPDVARAQARTWWIGSRHLGLVLSVLWLDAVLNLRFPNREASLW